MRQKSLWLAWAALSIALAGGIAWAVSFDRLNDAGQPLQARLRAWLAPAPVNPGHAQIGPQCPLCHGERPFAAGVADDKCIACHPRNDDNKAESTHPRAKFADPANAERLAALAADKCVTCHGEHQPGARARIGVTQPADFCIACHGEVARDTVSHEGFAFDTCTAAGCHSYHDNRATYRKLLRRSIGRGEPAGRRLPQRDFAARWRELGIVANPHGTARVGECRDCHAAEAAGFAQGKHGMRAAAGLAPMSPGRSALPFVPAAHGKTLSCTSCHAADRPDTRRAAVEACQSCHADEHTRAYGQSRHAALWQQEQAGRLPAGSGVSCATCHMPRGHDDAAGRIVVEHDQTANLRPVIKQARVCLACHALQFTHDALADRDLAGRRNFTGQPAVHVRSIEMEAARR